MNAQDIRVLERIFEAEILDRLPAQLKSKRLPALEKEDYIERMTLTLPGRFQVTVEGWTLTHRGRIAYCEYASTKSIHNGRRRTSRSRPG